MRTLRHPSQAHHLHGLLENPTQGYRASHSDGRGLSAGDQPTLVGKPLSGASKLQRELIAKDVVAIDPVDSGFALPTLAAQLAVNVALMFSHGSGKGYAQIKIASDAFLVGTGEAKQCLGISEIEGAFDLAQWSPAKRAEVGKQPAERLQLGKGLGQARSEVDPLALFMKVFAASAAFGRIAG